MKKKLAFILMILVVLGSTAPAFAQAGGVSSPWQVMPVPANKIDPALQKKIDTLQTGEFITVIVQLRQRATLPNGNNMSRSERLSRVIDALKATANGTQGPLRSLLQVQRRRGNVQNFNPFWIINGFSVTANANTIKTLTKFSDVLSISSDTLDIVPASFTPPTLGAPEQGVSLVMASSLWDMGYTGQGVVIASMDSGVDLSHPDLVNRWRGGTNSWYDPFGQHTVQPIDKSGHGTATMGVMVGGDAGGTSIGVAPGAQWIAARVFNDQGQSTATAVHLGYQWLLDPDSDPLTADAPQIVNNSWSYATPGCNLEFELDLQSLRAAGILPIFAAGNSGPSAGTSLSPANNPSAFAVGAINSSSLIYGLSSRGPTDCGGSTGVFPELVAPGVNINSTDLGGFYATSSGTSLSAPHVSGGLALLLSAYPNLSASQQESVLVSTGFDLGAAGPDDAYGNGRLDLTAAFQWLAAPPAETPTPTTSPIDTPTAEPTFTPTTSPVDTPTAEPTFTPITVPTDTPTTEPTFTPTAQPTFTPTTGPTFTPTAQPTFTQTSVPTSTSTPLPSSTPTVSQTKTTKGPIYFSTLGNTKPPGVGGTADDADIYYFYDPLFSRVIDASGSGSLLNLPGSANVDGFDRVDDTHFYLSFTGSVNVPGLGTVQDEDVVSYDAGSWSLYFDGSANGLGSSDLDAISFVGGSLYFSLNTTLVPPGAGGSGDDADIYRWNGGSSYTRIHDASARGWPTANVDGFVWVDATHFYVSYSSDVTVSGVGKAQDEDVLYHNNGVWMTYFEGTSLSLTSGNHDLDAFDIP
jgi:subtilisin family serine protease